VALVVFVSWQLVLAVMANFVIHYAAHGRRLLKPTVSATGLRQWMRVAALGPLIWFVALLAAIFVNATITLALIALLAVLFLLDVDI